MNSHVKSSAVLNFGTARQPFVDAGISSSSLIPIAPPGASTIGDSLRLDSLGKAPGRFLPDKHAWCGLKKENGSYLQNGVSDNDAADFASWPTGNVGILGRDFPAIDSDAETPAAARLVERAMAEAFGVLAPFAERVRGKCPRRLYVACVVSPGTVRSRTVEYRMPDDPEHVTHKLEIIGSGKQWVAAGIHPSGDQYRWERGAELADVNRLLSVTDADVDRLYNAFERELEKAGGTVVSKGGGGTGSHSSEPRDYSRDDPAMPVNAILRGLDALPNTRAKFPTHDSFVAVLSAIRAALGREAEDPETVDAIEDWATEHEDDTGADAAYFERTWQSLGKGVYAAPDALDRLFRRHGIFEGARYDFPDDAEAVAAFIKPHISEASAKQAALLREVAAGYLFGGVNLRTDDKATRVRLRSNVESEWSALAWWGGETLDDSVALLGRLRKIEGWGSKKEGFYRFLRALKKAHPDVFYSSEIKHPLYEIGDLVEEQDGQGNTSRKINMRPLPKAQKIAKRPARDARQAVQDTKTILEFMSRVFGRYVNYELDTLAYMAQTSRRPGHMLFLVGDQGTGKSAYAKMLVRLFDGDSPDSQVPGDKVADEHARRFILANYSGFRILNINELPEANNKAIVIAWLKQFVDGSVNGDRVTIERKAKDVQSVPNFARIVITTNYRDALTIEAGDRRTFYVVNGIDETNKPGTDYFAPIWAIIADPERLAAFWRYLLARDVSNYDFAAPPPMSFGKIEAEMLALENPCERHMEAALIVLARAGREMVNLPELAEVMMAMGENEYRSTGGNLDARREYHFQRPDGQEQVALRRLARRADRLRDLKSNGKRFPNVYVLRSADGRPSVRFAELDDASCGDILDALERDRKRHPLSENHPCDRFAGPVTKPRDAGH